MSYKKRLLLVVSLLVGLTCVGFPGRKTLKIEYLGKIVDCQGVTSLRPPTQERWTPLAVDMYADIGDLIRTDPRGANAVRVNLTAGGGYIVGPGSLVEIVDEKTLKITRGEVEVTSPDKKELIIVLPGKKKENIKGTAVLRVKEDGYEKLQHEPAWLKYFKGTIAREPMGSLLANVEGRNLPLTIGYHKVTVDIRDQIARTTIEESFKNNTKGTLEGVFHFPLPQDASIAGFGMWINGELVEADVVEKQRAREIYETILRERRDPGLLEWHGGNIFKARVFPIFPHSEKRIKITYTQVLPMENGKYRYSYALQSEMLKQFPLRELEVKVRLFSEQPLKDVFCPSHETRVNKTKNAASLEFSAQEYSPTKDFEVVVETGKGPEVVVIPHRRGDDGYFLLQVVQPDGGSKGRALIYDGPPLDLIVMADTSASMDDGQRKLQEEFLSFLMGSLGPKDKLQVAAVDMDCHWVSTDDLDTVLDFLQHRASLGTTDLEKVFGKVFEKAGNNTHIIYLGDAVDTTREADPVDTAQRLKRLYKSKGKGTVHAVATGSSFESGVMKVLAAASGGSSRRLEGETPARNGVVEILEELINPGIRDMKVSFSGVRAARVYPEELPNLPAGKQQIILGRYLPTDQKVPGAVPGVSVTGIYKGKMVSYSAPFILKEGEKGNSFIPRLWARMHLDSLLEQGKTQEIKDEIIALSEEYHIMTPYTSFLVLESDADRERFKVKRRVTMRDGEKFFAEGREKANYQLRQKYMQMAGKWRQDLRRDILRELLDLGREHYSLATPYFAHGWGNPNDPFASVDRVYAYGGRAAKGGASYSSSSVVNSMAMDSGGVEFEAMGAAGGWDEEDLDVAFDMPAASEMPVDGIGMDDFFDGDGDEFSEADPFATMGEPMNEMEDMKEEQFAYEEAMEAGPEMSQQSMLKQAEFSGTPSPSRRSYRRHREAKKKDRTSFDYSNLVGNGSVGGGKLQSGQAIYKGYRWQPYWNSWIDQLFPRLSPPMPEPVIVPQPGVEPWPEDVRNLAKSLLRQPALDQMSDALEINMKASWFDQRGELSGKSAFDMSYTPSQWRSVSKSNGGQSLVNWRIGEERAVYAPCFGLGRKRKADKADGKLAFDNFAYYNDFSLRGLENSYSGYKPSVTEKGDDKVLLTFVSPDSNSDYKIEFLIDTKRNVLLEHKSYQNGGITSSVEFNDFVKAGGCWWAQKIVSKNKDGKVNYLTTASVKESPKAKLLAQLLRSLPNKRDSIMIEHVLPDYETARQAKMDEKMTLDHHLAYISFYTNTQQWDKTRDVWKEAATLIKGRTGQSWLDMAVYIQTRRYEEGRLMLVDKAKLTTGVKGLDDLFVARHLMGWGNRIAQVNERIDLLNILKPVYERQPKYLKALRDWTRDYANALTNAGRRVEALAIWKKLNEEYPSDVSIATSYINAMVQNGQLEEAFAWMNERLNKNDFWVDHERENIRNSVRYQFENRIDTDKWLKFLKDWIADGTVNQDAYYKYLVALYRMHRTEESHRLVEKWAKDGLAHYKEIAGREKAPQYDTDEWKEEQRVRICMSAAVSQMLGQNYHYRHYSSRNRVEKRWHGLLSKLARETYRIEEARNIAQNIMNHHNYAKIDDAAGVRKEMKALLFSEVTKLKPVFIQQLVNWVGYNNPKVEQSEWNNLAKQIEKRWDSGKEEDQQKHTLGAVLVNVMGKAGDQDGITRFYRKQWKTGPEMYKAHYLNQFYNNLFGKPWTEAIEAELFSLIEKHTTVEAQENVRLVAMVPVLMRLVDKMITARQAATIEKVEGKDDLSRIEFRKLQKKHEKMARDGMVKRLKDEKSQQPGELHPWLDIERLYLEMKLGVDHAVIATGCWKLLPNEPPSLDLEKEKDDDEIGIPPIEPYPIPTPKKTAGKVVEPSPEPPREEEKGLTVLEAGLIDRCLTTLSCLAARHSADKALVVRVFDYMDRGIKLNPELPYWRYQKYRLLVGRNEPEPLEKALKSWISPTKADDTWRLALGYLLAELDRVAEAVKQFEAIEKNDGLGQKEYKLMAGWYMVLDEKEKYKEAELKELMVINEHQLSRRLRNILNPWRSRNETIPEELDPIAIRMFTVLFKKSPHPQSYVYQLQEFYRYTKDFRLLECMAEGVIGHTAAQAYPYLQGIVGLVNLVHEEATVDVAMEHLQKARKKAETQVDKRALDLMDMLIRRRAAEVDNQPGPHVEKAIVAMKRAFKGEWQAGERRLMADFLRNIGRMKSAKLKEEQLRQFKALNECQTEPDQDRLYIAVQYAYILNSYQKRDDAIDVLEAALAEYREKMGGAISASANDALGRLISYLEDGKKYMRAEAYLNSELKNPINRQQRYWLMNRKFTVYSNALRNNGTVSLGSGQELFDAVLDLCINELDNSDQNYRSQVISQIANFFHQTKNKKLNGNRIKEFAFKIFPKFLEKETNQHNYHSHVSSISYALREVIGARDALEFLIIMIEKEPEWVRHAGNSGWGRHSYNLARYRSEAGQIGDLEPRLLNIVLAELRRDLEFRSSGNRTIYSRNNSYYWSAKENDFKAVAEEMWRKQKDSGAAALYISDFMWNCMYKKQRAVEILRYAYEKDTLDLNGRVRFVHRLHELSLYKESVPVLERLISEHPGQIDYRVRLIMAFHRSAQPSACRETLEKADKYFHEPARWHEHIVYQLARVCREIKYNKEALKYYKELIPMHKRNQPKRGVGSYQLSNYYRELSQVCNELKLTAEAVDAASGAIIVWGGNHQRRAEALRALDNVVAQAHDLDDYVKEMEKQVEDTGLENPILRKAIGKAYAGKGKYAEAIKHLKAAAEAQPNDAQTHQELIQAYDMMKDHDGAIAQILESVKLSRRDINLYKTLGDRYKDKLNNEVESERAYMSIAEMLPHESEGHTMLAQLRQSQNRWEEAVYHWKQVVRVRTLEPTGFMNLAAAQIHLKKFDDVRETIKILDTTKWPPRFGNLRYKIDTLRRKLPPQE